MGKTVWSGDCADCGQIIIRRTGDMLMKFHPEDENRVRRGDYYCRDCSDSHRLGKANETIGDPGAAPLEVGQALLEVKEQKLWKRTRCRRFAEYVAAVGLDKTIADELMCIALEERRNMEEEEQRRMQETMSRFYQEVTNQ